MTKIDHAKLNRRSPAGRAAKGPSHQATNAKARTRYAQLALDHRDEIEFCRSVSDQVNAGRTVSKKQAAVLGRIEAELRGVRAPMKPRVSKSGGRRMVTRQMTAEEMGRM